MVSNIDGIDICFYTKECAEFKVVETPNYSYLAKKYFAQSYKRYKKDGILPFTSFFDGENVIMVYYKGLLKRKYSYR